MQKLKAGFNTSLAEIITILIEFLLIGAAQLLMSYGAIGLLITIYVVARFHNLSRKGVHKLLTR